MSSCVFIVYSSPKLRIGEVLVADDEADFSLPSLPSHFLAEASKLSEVAVVLDVGGASCSSARPPEHP
jgi:hypothetical protein